MAQRLHQQPVQRDEDERHHGPCHDRHDRILEGVEPPCDNRLPGPGRDTDGVKHQRKGNIGRTLRSELPALEDGPHDRRRQYDHQHGRRHRQQENTPQAKVHACPELADLLPRRLRSKGRE